MEQYTQIPNYIFDEWMKIMTGSAFKVLMAICRKTLGWQKESDNIGMSQICALTNLPKKSVIRSIKELENKELIIVDRTSYINRYSLNLSGDIMTPIQDKVVTLGNQYGDTMTPVLAKSGDIMTPTKESNKEKTKETSSHHKLITYFTNKYYDLTECAFDWSNKKHIKQVQLLLKNHTEKEIYNKLKILEQLIKNNNSTFWIFTPDFVNSQWNNIFIRNKQQPEKEYPYKKYDNAKDVKE